MAIPKFTDDLNIISKLGDNPGSDNGLTTQEFREAFDKAPLLIQKFINDILIPAANASGSPEEGLNMQGPINMNSKKLSGIRTPTSDDEAVNWGSVKYIGKVQRVEVTLLADDWVEDDVAGFANEIIVDGLSDNKKVRVFPNWPSALAEKLALSEDVAKVRSCTRDGSTLTFEAWEEKPKMDIPVIVEVIA